MKSKPTNALTLSAANFPTEVKETANILYFLGGDDKTPNRETMAQVCAFMAWDNECNPRKVRALFSLWLKTFSDKRSELVAEAMTQYGPRRVWEWAVMAGIDAVKEAQKSNDATPEHVLDIAPGLAHTYLYAFLTDALSTKKQEFSLHQLHSELQARGESVYFDVITREVVIIGADDFGKDVRIPIRSQITRLHSDLKPVYNGVTMKVLQEYLIETACSHSRNLVLECLEKIPLDESRDMLGELFALMQIPEADSLSRILVEKWLYQAVAMAFNTDEAAVGADGMLVLNGPQGAGKSLLCSQMALNQRWFASLTLDLRNKDSVISAVKRWIVELGELETSLRRNEEDFKAFITRAEDSIRLPYAPEEETHARRTCFIATCNSVGFLTDETGNRRFWVVPIGCNLDPPKILAFDFRQLWAQIYTSFVQSGKDSSLWRLSLDERAAVEDRNAGYRATLPGEDEIRDILSDANRNPDKWKWIDVTVSNWMNADHSSTHPAFAALRRYSAKRISRALTAIGIPQRRSTTASRERLRYLPVPNGSYLTRDAES